MTARRVAEIGPFLAVEIAELAFALERAGVDVVHLEFGEPDFEAPPVVADAVMRAIKDGRTKYTSSLGILPLREAVVDHYAATYGVRISPAQVLVTPGTSPAMMLLFGHLLDPGDEVVLGDPYYACYPNFIRYAEGRPVTVPTTEAAGFALHATAVRERLSPRTRAVLINSPANPTGAVMTAGGMAEIGEVTAHAGAFVVSDEIYHGLVYEGRARSILEFTDRAFVLNGFSKAFAMTGWRLGYVIGPTEDIRAMQKVFGNFFISTNEFVQWAGVAALREAAEETRRFRAIFAERRRVMVDGLRRVGLGVGFEPAGAFYVLANARAYTQDSTRFARTLLEEANVAVTPGAAFGPGAEGYLRFSYASSIERIEEGLRRIERFLSALR
ncbi:MAG TPA: pyridoxal phosphate-dependent aminotransferase [Methylomirabilota bacterium]|jgi:aspartate/methionine/tyrosine aminotransferase|nr:pyridoxal phosphate-dependent aminotransferase [Methylomirabilota bacterium]